MKNGLLTAYDRLKFEFVKTGTDDEMLRLADLIKGGNPVVATFVDMDPKVCNYFLSFLSGVVYALNGKAIPIGNDLFIFGTEEDFKDGSLERYIEDVK